MIKQKQFTEEQLIKLIDDFNSCDPKIKRFAWQAREVIKEIRAARKEDADANVKPDIAWLKDYHDKMREQIKNKNKMKSKIKSILSAYNKSKKKKGTNVNKKRDSSESK